MSVAVITNGDRTASRMLAGMTRVQFSGMDSYVAQSSPPDCAIHGTKWVWDFGDGSSGYGGHVSHVYAIAGTYVVKLTFYGDDNHSDTKTTTVTINPTPNFASYFVRYVDWAAGNDGNTGLDSSHPFKTIERAFHDWRTGGKLGTLNWGAIFLNKGVTHTYAALQDATHDANPDYGPLFITSYGLGTRPLLSMANVDFVIDENHDASFDHGVQVDGVDFAWAAPTTKGFEWTHRGSQISNSVITNARLLINSTGGGGSAFFNVENKNASLGPFVSSTWLDFESCYFHANGSNGDGIGPGPFDHQLYMSAAVLYSGVRNCVFDQTGAVAAYAGIKTSGARKVYILNPIVFNSDAGFDVGANPGDTNTQDVVYENPKLTGITRFGFYCNALDRVSIRNPIVLQGCSNAVLRLQSNDSSHFITDLQFLGGSIVKPTGLFVYKVTTWLVNAVIENNAVTKAAASGPFLKAETGLDMAGATYGGNCYFRDGGSHSQSGFALMGATDQSFDQWVASGKDTVKSKYADPGFASLSDVTIGPTSPCVEAGISLSVLAYDSVGTQRPQGSAFDIGAYEYPGSTSVLIDTPVMQGGMAVSPVVIPCWANSNAISPFMRDLKYSHSTHDSPAQNFERWEDTPANFACWGNGEPLPYVDEEGVTVGPHQGRVSSTKTGPTGPVLNNFLVTEWFLKKFVPKAIAWNTLANDDIHETKPLTNGTGEERRYYYPPPMRRALLHPDPNERKAGWDAINSINRETIERRPFFHNAKNGNQSGGPVPFLENGGPPEEVNHNLFDQFGNARSWNAVGSKANYSDGNQWNAWDKQHNAGPAFHMPAAIGSRAAMVNLWNNWRWVISGFYPFHDQNNGYQFDVPRSAGWAAFLGVYAYMAGFDWADNQMIRVHCGGRTSGNAQSNNGNGWKPSLYFEWIVRVCIGNAVSYLGNPQPMPDAFIYFSRGCSNLGVPSCLCDCGAGNPPAPGPGKSGCDASGNWVGPDGVNYGNQTKAVDLWHAGIECSALVLVDSLNDYLLQIWGQGQAILSAQTAGFLKQLLAYAAGEAVIRAINSGDYATAHYYCVKSGSQSSPPGAPRGHDFSVAQAMLDDMFFCHPDKAQLCELRQMNDGSGLWVVAELARYHVDLFYSLSIPWLTYVLGPNNPIVQSWLTSGQYICLPGSEGPDQKTYYELHARLADFAQAMLENGTSVFITASTMSTGASQDGFLSHPVVIQAATMAAGAFQDGNYFKQVVIKASTMRAGARELGSFGIGINILNTLMAAAAVVDGNAFNPILIDTPVMAAGAKELGNFQVGGGGTQVIITASLMRAGAKFFFNGLIIGSGVVITDGLMQAGAAQVGGKGPLITDSILAAGAAEDGEWVLVQSIIVKAGAMSAGATVKGGKVKTGRKNKFDASGSIIIVEE